MTIKARLGIGDLLILKMICEQYNFTNDIIINTQIISDYRNNNQTYLKFIKWLVERLFGSQRIIYLNEPNYDTTDFGNYMLDDVSIHSIQKYFNLNLDPEHLNCEYIVFHTKCRIDTDLTAYFNEYKIKIKSFMTNYKAKCKIVLLGERIIEPNTETKIHQIDSLYDELVRLKSNNDVLDLTTETLSNTPDCVLFENDIKIIRNAKSNIGFGFGGNLVMVSAFAKNYDFFIGSLSHIYLNNIIRINSNNMKLHNNMDKFLECIAEY